VTEPNERRADSSSPGDDDAVRSVPGDRSRRVVLAALLGRPLPPHVVAADPARARRIRAFTRQGYISLAIMVCLLILAVVGSGPAWVQWLRWLIAAVFLVAAGLWFVSAVNARRGKRPRRPLRR